MRLSNHEKEIARHCDRWFLSKEGKPMFIVTDKTILDGLHPAIFEIKNDNLEFVGLTPFLSETFKNSAHLEPEITGS